MGYSKLRKIVFLFLQTMSIDKPEGLLRNLRPIPPSDAHTAKVNFPLVLSFLPPIESQVFAIIIFNNYESYYQILTPVDVIPLQNLEALRDWIIKRQFQSE